MPIVSGDGQNILKFSSDSREASSYFTVQFRWSYMKRIKVVKKKERKKKEYSGRRNNPNWYVRMKDCTGSVLKPFKRRRNDIKLLLLRNIDHRLCQKLWP